MKFGYQLSSITPYLQTEDDLRDSLHKIAAIGYTEVQLQGVSYTIPDNGRGLGAEGKRPFLYRYAGGLPGGF